MITREAPKALINSALAWLPQLDLLIGAYVAGGFIRAYFAGETPHDMDIYFTYDHQFDDALRKLQDTGFGEPWTIAAETPRAVTLKLRDKTIQLIRFVFGEEIEVIKQFDFTVCAAALWMVPRTKGVDPAGHLILHDDFFEHLAGRILVFQGSPLPLASLKRAVKYIKRGYSICDENLIALAEAISKAVEFDKPESVEQHIQGMDPAGGRRIRVID